MPPNASTANTGDGTILPPPAVAANPNAAPSTAQSDQALAANLPPAPVATSILPTATPAPSFAFKAPDMPTVGYIDPSGYTDMTALSAAEAAQRAALSNAQSGVQQNVFGQYQQAIDAQGSSLDQYNKLATQMNLPVYQQQVSTIKGLLSRLTDDINSRAQGTFMNQAQRDQLEASEGKTLNNQLAPLAQAQSDAENNITRMMGFTQQDNQAKLDPIKAYLASLGESFGRQSSALDANNTSASGALQSRLDAEDKARMEAQAAQQAQWQHEHDLATEQISRESAALQAKYNNIMAGLSAPKAAPQPVATAPKLSDAQVNSALWLRANGGNNPNYKSAPVPVDYGNPLANFAAKYHLFGIGA